MRTDLKTKDIIYIVLGLACIFVIIFSWLKRPSYATYELQCAKAEIITALNKLEIDTGSKNENSLESNSIEKSKEIDLAKCSDLSAQWTMTDIAFVSYFAGLVGILFIGITLWETLTAGRALSEQNKIALDATKAEFQPYLSFSNLGLWQGDKVENIMEGTTVEALFQVLNGDICLSFNLHISNWGKTPAQNIRFQADAILKDSRMKHGFVRGENFDPMIDFSDYLTESDGKEEIIFNVRIANKDGLPVTKNFVDLLRVYIEVRFRIFFTDQFTKGERCYECIFEGIAHDEEILKKSVKEIK